MRKLLFIFIFFGITINLISCSKDTEPNTEETLVAEVFKDVPYGSSDQQKFDIYLPANRSEEKTKVIVLVHGGGWTGGDKADMDYIIPFLLSEHPQHAIVNVNYVLADVDTPAFPNQFLDLKAVINKLTLEHKELYILPEFALIGASAGAHISLMYDYTYDLKDQIKMVGDIVGPTNFTDPFYSNNPGFPTYLAALVDESAYPPATDYATALSPALQVSSTSSPTLLFYGNEDPLVPLSNADSLNMALNEAQIDHTLNVFEGGHGNWSAADYEVVRNKISEYIETYLPISE